MPSATSSPISLAIPKSAKILDELLGNLSEDVEIRRPLQVDYGTQISIGACTFSYNLTALDVATIYMGQDCQIGPHVQLLTPTDPLDPLQRRDKLESTKPITSGNNVWLGGGLIILPGAEIEDNTIIGAGP